MLLLSPHSYVPVYCRYSTKRCADQPPLKIHMHTSYLILAYIQQICASLPTGALTHSLNFLFVWNHSLYHNPHLLLVSERIFLHGWLHAAYSVQDSCLPHIMCPLRTPSGRWKPTRALGLHRGSYLYGKICKHMALNRDVQRFSLQVPPTCRIWLKCNEVLVREGRWLRWLDSHYCPDIGCHSTDATLWFILSVPKEHHETWLHTTENDFPPSLPIHHNKQRMCVIINFSYFHNSLGFGTGLAHCWKQLDETVQYSFYSEGWLSNKPWNAVKLTRCQPGVAFRNKQNTDLKNLFWPIENCQVSGLRKEKNTVSWI